MSHDELYMALRRVGLQEKAFKLGGDDYEAARPAATAAGPPAC